MSIMINIAGKQAVLADGKWRSADASIAELLNAHLATERVPGHYPPNSRELLATQAVVRELGGQIIDQKLQPDDPGRMPDGRLKVF